jgi:Tol biopolymer transport system component
VKRTLVVFAAAAVLCGACGAKEESGGSPQLCVDRSKPVESGLDKPEHLNWAPAWSPDGKQLAFSSTRSGDYGVHVIRLDTCKVRHVTSGINPAWSPDGKRLAIEREESGAGSPSRIFLVGVDGQGLRQITTGDAQHPSSDSFPDWSSAGIVFARDIEISSEVEGLTEFEVLSVRPDGNEVRVLARGKAVLSSPKWSPDEQQVAFTCEDGLAVCVMRADGTNKTVAIRAERDAQASAWSPDGQTIVFSGNGGNGGLRLFLAPTRGGKPNDLSPAAENGDGPSWSPDGRWIAFDRATELGSDLYLIRPDGTGLRRLTEPS